MWARMFVVVGLCRQGCLWWLECVGKDVCGQKRMWLECVGKGGGWNVWVRICVVGMCRQKMCVVGMCG